MPLIQDVKAREILDSRGFPTIEVDIHIASGAFARASVPSGASKGSFEALELRDNDEARYFGKGVLNAVESVNQKIADTIIGFDVRDQTAIDNALIETDDTDNKENLGANAILGVSLACAKAAANYYKMPLYKYIGGMRTYRIPVPLMNIINGGAHADNGLDIQEFMIVPHGAESFSEALRMGSEIFHTLKDILKKSGQITAVGDEGGFAPNLSTAKEALDLIMMAIEKSGYKPEEEVLIALDVAATELYKNGQYNFIGEKQSFTGEELVDFYKDLCNIYPIFSIEDGFAENDWDSWSKATSQLEGLQLVGDDLFVTNPSRLIDGLKKKAANAILIKPNQIGSLTETIGTINIANSIHYNTIMSHRSGETEDCSIADLAVAMGVGQIKAGSLSRTDRLAKYNQLLRIEEELSPNAQFFL